MSSDSDNSVSEYDSPKKTKKAVYRQKYIKSWETDERFKGWIGKSKKGDYFFHCNACDCDNKCGISELERHRSGKKHMNNVKSKSKQHTLFSLASTSRQTTLEHKVKEAEIKLASFVVEHNVPMSIMPHLTKLIKSVCPDSEISRKISCGRTKCGEIIKNVIGLESREELCTLLKDNPFSLIVDESTDVGTVKHMSLVVRVATNDFQVKDHFFALIPLKDATAVSLHASIKEVFETQGIPYKENMIGFASDGANVMLGVNHSLSTLLKNEIPNLFIMKCICHSFHLCASYACLKLPRGVEDMARDVYNYFKNSPKRSAELREFQEFLKLKPHKILHPSQTRWLSLLQVVNRLIEQLPALKLYFTNAAISDRILAAESILNKLSDPSTELYLGFLQFILPLFNDLNKEMQSERPKIHTLFDRVSVAFRTIVECYLKPEYVAKTDVCDLQYRDPTNFLSIEEIYLGGRVTAAIYSKSTGLNENEIKAFKTRCLDFLIEGANQIYKRFPFKSPFKLLKIIAPSEVIHKKSPSIVPLSSLFPGLVNVKETNDIDMEWRQLRNESLEVEDDICAFWRNVSCIKRGDGIALYPLVSRFVRSLLCFPHSSATVERIFSSINLMKTKQRNKLETKMIASLLHAKRAVMGTSCYNMSVTKQHISKMNSSMYDFKRKINDSNSDSESE